MTSGVGGCFGVVLVQYMEVVLFALLSPGFDLELTRFDIVSLVLIFLFQVLRQRLRSTSPPSDQNPCVSHRQTVSDRGMSTLTTRPAQYKIYIHRSATSTRTSTPGTNSV